MGKSATLSSPIALQGCNSDEGSMQEQLEQELAEAKLLHRLSIELIQEEGTKGLYKKIVEAAVAIMGSQYGSMQMLVQDAGGDKLELLASYNFTEDAEKFWQWVYPHTGSSCGAALRSRQRAIVPDFEASEFMQDKPTLPIFLGSGIYAAQSTPLFSRSGKLVGMISTHWTYPHNPSERHLYLLDVLARQAADLIERAQTDEALRQSEERLRALASATNDAIYRMSADWSEMYQLDGRNFLSDTTTTIRNWREKYVHPDDVGHVASAILRATETKTVFQLEHRVMKADGCYGWTFSRAVPIFDQKGNIIEWFGAASDITDKRTLLEHLEERVEERTRELQRSNEDLQQFAHVASHDLKEPVRKIQVYGQRLRDDLRNNNTANTGLYAQKILQSASRMSTMIEGVLNYSSLSTIDQQQESVDLNKIIVNITDDLDMLINEKGAVVKTGKLPVLEGSEVLIYQLFYNLIYNSLKFSKNDPVITINAETLSVHGRVYSRISVNDNGIGFDPRHNETIFKTFTRLHANHKYEGTGLGLSLAKKIVDRHHGTIKASGKKGEGATFTIMLPLTRRR
jgi:signal transduction histidine kinase